MVTDQIAIIDTPSEIPIKMNKIKMAVGDEGGEAVDVDKLVETVLQDAANNGQSVYTDATVSVVTDSDDISQLPDYSDVNDDDGDVGMDEGDEDEEMVDLLDYDEVFAMIKLNGARSFIDEQLRGGVTLNELYELFEVGLPDSSDPVFLQAHLEDEVNQMALDYDEEDGMDEDDGSSCPELSSDDDESSLLSEAERAEREAQAMAILTEIREKGPMGFVDEQEALGASASAFLRSIGYSMPQSLQPLDLHSQWTFVRKFLLKYVYQRPRRPDCETVDDAVRLIAGATRIMVVTGAGISVSCGIPDFRSEHGLYASIRERFALPEPECMFDIEYFRDDPEPFFVLAKVNWEGDCAQLNCL
jgi:hypothetical protein